MIPDYFGPRATQAILLSVTHSRSAPEFGTMTGLREGSAGMFVAGQLDPPPFAAVDDPHWEIIGAKRCK